MKESEREWERDDQNHKPFEELLIVYDVAGEQTDRYLHTHCGNNEKYI